MDRGLNAEPHWCWGGGGGLGSAMAAALASMHACGTSRIAAVRFVGLLASRASPGQASVRAFTLVVGARANGGRDDTFWTEGIMRYFATKPYPGGLRYRKRVLGQYRDESETVGEVVSDQIESRS